jgi:hypothetical protein
MTRPIYETAYDLSQINKCRATNGLPPITPTKSKCLRCGKEIEVWFPKRERFCDYCNYLRYNQNAGSIGER